MFHHLIRREKSLGLVLLLLPGLVFTASGRGAEDNGSKLKLAVILSRHGVRSPLLSNETLSKYSAEPWPSWPVPPGFLTPHGRQQMELMGAYYRALYTREGLLTGKTDQDLPRIFFRTNSMPRTLESGRALGAGLLPGGVVVVHARRMDVTDPLFQPAKLPVGHPDPQRGIAAVLGRVGGNLAAVEQAYASTFSRLQHVLFGPGAAPPAGKTALLDQPTEVQAGANEIVTMKGALAIASSLVDSLLLEYAEGMPPEEVGWGRVTPQELNQLLQLHALHFNLGQGTFYSSQVQASNLASHLLKTFKQAVNSRPESGALGNPEQRLVVLVGHDTNLINFGGLLGLGWWLPGTQMNPVLPGGAIVLELRQRHRDGQFVIRAHYVSATLEQIRALAPLTGENPPDIAPIFIPGCSEAGPGFDAPFSRFEKLLHRVIDPEFVLPGTD